MAEAATQAGVVGRDARTRLRVTGAIRSVSDPRACRGVRGALAKLAMGDIIGDRACWPTDRVGLEAGDDAVGQRCSICNSTRLIASSSSFSADMDVRSVCRSRCSSRSLGFSRTSRRIRARVRGRSVKRLGCVIGSTADLIAQTGAGARSETGSNHSVAHRVRGRKPADDFSLSVS